MATAGDQAGDDHEDEEGRRELGRLRGAGLRPPPRRRRRSARRARARSPCSARGGDLDVDLDDGDRAVALEVERLEVAEDDAGVLAGDVGQDQVALRLLRDPLEVDHVADGVAGPQQLDHLARPVGGRDECAGAARDGSIRVTYPSRIGVYERWDAERHTDGLVAMGEDPEVMRFLGGVQPRAAMEELSRRVDDHWQTFGFGLWAVMLDGACAGFAGACHPGPGWDAPYDREVEVGWRLARSAWGRGLATEGARHAIVALERDRVIAFVDPDNTASVAVVERLGMALTGTTHNRRLHRDVDVYALALSADGRAAPRPAR